MSVVAVALALSAAACGNGGSTDKAEAAEAADPVASAGPAVQSVDVSGGDPVVASAAEEHLEYRALVGGASGARAEDPVPPKIAIEVLSKHAAFPDDVSMQVKRKLPGQGADVLNLADAGHVVTARLVVPPGAAFPWHTHPGPVLVSVTQGALIYQQASDCVERDYGPQDAFVDPGTKLHTAWNPGPGETVLVATFLGVPAGGAVTIPDLDQSNRCS